MVARDPCESGLFFFVLFFFGLYLGRAVAGLKDLVKAFFLEAGRNVAGRRGAHAWAPFGARRGASGRGGRGRCVAGGVRRFAGPPGAARVVRGEEGGHGPSLQGARRQVLSAVSDSCCFTLGVWLQKTTTRDND